MLAKFAKLAGFGAYGACAGLAGLYGLFVSLTRPGGTGGLDGISAAVTWISVGGLVVALILAHVVIAKQLMRLSRGEDVRHPL